MSGTEDARMGNQGQAEPHDGKLIQATVSLTRATWAAVVATMVLVMATMVLVLVTYQVG